MPDIKEVMDRLEDDGLYHEKMEGVLLGDRIQEGPDAGRLILGMPESWPIAFPFRGPRHIAQSVMSRTCFPFHNPSESGRFMMMQDDWSFEFAKMPMELGAIIDRTIGDINGKHIGCSPERLTGYADVRSSDEEGELSWSTSARNTPPSAGARTIPGVYHGPDIEGWRGEPEGAPYEGPDIEGYRGEGPEEDPMAWPEGPIGPEDFQQGGGYFPPGMRGGR